MTQSQAPSPTGRPRARGLGVPFDGLPGRHNAITDVDGVTVGYASRIEGADVRTGVTAICPRGAAGAPWPVAAGVHRQNGNGEMTGVAWIEEAGTLSGPVMITSTHAVGAVHAATVAWQRARHPALRDAWLLPVVAETWDGFLSDGGTGHVSEAMVFAALDGARAGAIEEGAVGGGTGMICYAFKGGSGTASRRVAFGSREHTVGAFVQANFGARAELTVAGVHVGRAVDAHDPFADPGPVPAGSGSVIVVLATDAPLLPGQLTALARRAPLGLARTGTIGSHYSGDLIVAFSTANRDAFGRPGPDQGDPPPAYASLAFVPWAHMDPLFEAAVEAVEEAVVNALVAGTDMTGREGRWVPALPHDQLRRALGLAPSDQG